MTKCEQCGATIDPLVFACPYCHLTTRAGVVASQRGQAAAQAQAQWAAAVDYQKRQASLMQIRSTANQSIWFALGGFMCTPLGIVSIVQALRAKSMAAAAKTEIPGTATVGLVLGICSCFISVGVIIGASISNNHDEAKANARIAALDKVIGTKSANATLDREVACELAEQTALRDGWNGEAGSRFENIQCVGAYAQTATTAQLDDFSFKAGDGTHYKTFVCFKHGPKWYVENLSDVACDVAAADSADVASATASESAAPTSSARPTHKSTPKHTH